MNKKYLLILTLIPFLLVGCSLKPTPTDDEVKTTPPAEVLDENGEVDEMKFEDAQEVSDDTSLGTLEKELDETIILEEDFSDL